MKPTHKFITFSLSGVIFVSAVMITVLLMAKESLTSTLALSLMAGSAVAGFLIGALVSCYILCRQREDLEPFEHAIWTLLIPLIICAIGGGALMENPTPGERREIYLMMVVASGWWLGIVFCAAAAWRGRNWGNTLLSILLIAPLAVILLAVFWGVIAEKPPPDSIWHNWRGVRAVCVVLLAPVAIGGLFIAFAKGQSGCTIMTGVLAAGLVIGAAAGEWLLRPYGWNVAGAFAGATIVIAVMIGGLAGAIRIWDKKPERRPE